MYICTHSLHVSCLFFVKCMCAYSHCNKGQGIILYLMLEKDSLNEIELVWQS